MGLSIIDKGIRLFNGGLSDQNSPKVYNERKTLSQLSQEAFRSDTKDFRLFLSRFGTRQSTPELDFKFIIALNKIAEFGEGRQRVEARSILIMLAEALQRSPEDPGARAFKAICQKMVQATLHNEQLSSKVSQKANDNMDRHGYRTLEALSPLLITIGTDGDSELKGEIRASLRRTKERLDNIGKFKSGNGLVDLYTADLVRLDQKLIGGYVFDPLFAGTRKLNAMEKLDAVGESISDSIRRLARHNDEQLLFAPELKPVFGSEVKINWISQTKQTSPQRKEEPEAPVGTTTTRTAKEKTGWLQKIKSLFTGWFSWGKKDPALDLTKVR